MASGLASTNPPPSFADAQQAGARGSVLPEEVALDDQSRSLDGVQSAAQASGRGRSAGDVLPKGVAANDRARWRGLADKNAPTAAISFQTGQIAENRGVEKVETGVPAIDAASTI